MAQNYWDITCATHMTKYIVDRWLINEAIIPNYMKVVFLANNNQVFPIDIIDVFLGLTGDEGCSSNMFHIGNTLGYEFDPSQHKIVKILTFSPEVSILPQFRTT